MGARAQGCALALGLRTGPRAARGRLPRRGHGLWAVPRGRPRVVGRGWSATSTLALTVSRFVVGYIKQEFRLTFLWLSAGGALAAVVCTRLRRRHRRHRRHRPQLALPG